VHQPGNSEQQQSIKLRKPNYKNTISNTVVFIQGIVGKDVFVPCSALPIPPHPHPRRLLLHSKHSSGSPSLQVHLKVILRDTLKGEMFTPNPIVLTFLVASVENSSH